MFINQLKLLLYFTVTLNQVKHSIIYLFNSTKWNLYRSEYKVKRVRENRNFMIIAEPETRQITI